MKAGWNRVNGQHPCPVCGKPDWCGYSDEGAACCMRIVSDRPARNGGWIHNATDQPGPAPPHRQWTAAAGGYEAPDFNATLWWQTVRFVATWDRMDIWADRLGLPIDALDCMGACVLGAMLTFPMFDGHGKVCGIRTRNRDGSKRAVTGSRSGVFLPTFRDGAEPLVCEGPTDAIAALALGFSPIGRPSCTGCERHVVDTCQRLRITRITVCADADGPGIAGARKLAEVLHAARVAVRMVTPCGHKDLRDWYKAGATRATIDAQWSQAEWRG